MTDLWIWDVLKKINEDGNDKLAKEERALKTGFKKQFKGKYRVCGKIGHKGTDCWTLDCNKEKRPTGYNDKNNGNKNYKFNGNCNYCDKKGHKEADCRAKQRDNTNNSEEEFALITTSNIKKTNVEEWIGDTGATCHTKSNTNGMYELEICKGIKIDTANGSTSMVTHIEERFSAQMGWKMYHHEERKGRTRISEKSIFSIHSNAQQLGLADGDKSRQESIKNKEKRRRIQIR